MALFATGAIAGISPVARCCAEVSASWGIGAGAAAATYALGRAFGATVG